MPRGVYDRTKKKAKGKAKKNGKAEVQYVVLDIYGMFADDTDAPLKSEKEVQDYLETLAGNTGDSDPAETIREHRVFHLGPEVPFTVIESQISVVVGKG